MKIQTIADNFEEDDETTSSDSAQEVPLSSSEPPKNKIG